MKKSIIVLSLALLWNAAALAGETLYSIRVDGLACPYCAYGIEKKLDQIDGVKFVDLDLEKGIVTAQCAEGVTLTNARMEKLMNDAGFTFRGMEAQAL